MDVPGTTDAKAILYTKENDVRFVIPTEKCKTVKDIHQYIKSVHTGLSSTKFFQVGNFFWAQLTIVGSQSGGR